jgi:hypothetical protein
MFMNKYKLSTFALIAVVLVSLFWGAERNEYADSQRIEKERVERDTKKQLNTLRQEALAERKARKAIEAENLTLRKTSKKSDSTATIWQKRYTHEKNKKFGHFSDAGYDSLVTGLYPN